MIIGLNSRIGGGKDTVANMIQFLSYRDKGYVYSFEKFTNDTQSYKSISSGWQIRKFADKLKQIASILTGIPKENFENQEFKKSYLGEEWSKDEYQFPFAGPYDPPVKEKMSVREFLQVLGTDAIRDNLHENTWVNALMCDYKHISTLDYEGLPNWIVSDMRFPNEFEAVKSRGITVRIERPNNPYPQSNHSTETALDGYNFDYTIINDGDLETLFGRVEEFMRLEKLIK